MSRTRWLVVIGLLVVIVIALAALVRDRDASVTAPIPSPTALSSEAAIGSPSVPGPSGATDPDITVPPSVTPDPTPAPTPAPTTRPIATGDPRLLYAEFLLRVNDDRSTVAALNQRLSDAAEAGDRAAVRSVAIDILDFADAEQDWLREHRPAACYADAHEAANTMLAAYRAAADAFIAWADAGTGLDGLAAFAVALEAAGAAGDALTVFGRELEVTTCLG